MQTMTIKNDAVKYTLTKRDYTTKDWQNLMSYVKHNVSISEEIKADLAEKVWEQGLPLEYANQTIADKIGNAMEDWCFDNNVDSESVLEQMDLEYIYETVTDENLNCILQ